MQVTTTVIPQETSGFSDNKRRLIYILTEAQDGLENYTLGKRIAHAEHNWGKGPTDVLYDEDTSIPTESSQDSEPPSELLAQPAWFEDRWALNEER